MIVKLQAIPRQRENSPAVVADRRQFRWRDPWGTTYGANLRLLADNMPQDQWTDIAKTLKSRPPIPWFNLNAMSDEDLKAMYQFLRYPGPAGTSAPYYVPPGKEPDGPQVLFSPAQE